MPKNLTKLRRLQKRQQQRQQRRASADGRQNSSPPRSLAPSRWHQRPADECALVERFDDFAPLRNALRSIGEERGDWAGIPMPLDGERLVVEPRYPNAEAFMRMGGDDAPPPGRRLAADAKHRNTFWSSHLRSDVVIVESGSSVTWGLVPGANHLRHDLRTLGCSEAWGIEQESNALATLSGLVKHRAMKQYLLTGMFLESSPRSGVTYLFRKLKPTVAIHTVKGEAKILCALCMHPIAYYAGSWAGAMCPTDDVIAHLMLMRGDERMFWARANQHPAWVPEAGL